VTPDELLAAADGLLERPDAATEGLWARAAALLIRQALEGAARAVLADRAPGAQAASFAAQWTVLGEVLEEEAAVGRRAAWAWAALTAACHADELRLPPTAPELRRWRDVAHDLADLG